MWGYVMACSVLAGFGAFHSSVPMILTAFAVVVGFRIYEEMYQMGAVVAIYYREVRSGGYRRCR